MFSPNFNKEEKNDQEIIHDMEAKVQQLKLAEKVSDKPLVDVPKKDDYDFLGIKGFTSSIRHKTKSFLDLPSLWSASGIISIVSFISYIIL